MFSNFYGNIKLKLSAPLVVIVNGLSKFINNIQRKTSKRLTCGVCGVKLSLVNYLSLRVKFAAMVSEVKQRVNAAKPALKKNESESSKKKDSKVANEKKSANSKEANIQTKFGPMGIKKEDQLWSRAVLMTGVLVIVIVMKWKKTNEITWVSSQETVTKSKQPLICSTTFLDEINKFEGNKHVYHT
jgi:hypothetical protein